MLAALLLARAAPAWLTPVWVRTTSGADRSVGLLGEGRGRRPDAVFRAATGLSRLGLRVVINSRGEIVTGLTVGDLEVFTFTESDSQIRLRRDRSHVQVSASYTDDVAMVEYEELLEATGDFLQRVTTQIFDEYPDLRRNPYVQKVLREALG